MTRTSAWFFLIFLLAITMLACNLPVTKPPPPIAPPTAALSNTSTGNSIPAKTNSPQPYDDVYASPTNTPNIIIESGTPLPTFTPILLAPTATSRANRQQPNEESNNGVTGSSMTDFSPLALDYDQTWEIDGQDEDFAWATVILTATGGDESYTYFRDGNQQPTNRFSYRWRSCIKNQGEFQVNSGDGQSITVAYTDQSLCP